MTRWFHILCLGLLGLLLGGCIHLEQRIQINPNGSGVVTYEYSVAEETFGTVAAGRMAIGGWQDPPVAGLNWFASERAVNEYSAGDEFEVQQYRTTRQGARRHVRIVVLAGDRGFPELPEAARRNLELYLRAGGTLLCDSSEGDSDGEFRRSVGRELEAILPDYPLTRIPGNHVVYKSFYLIDETPGRTRTADYMEACDQDGRLLVLYSHNDLLGAFARDNFGNWLYEVRPGGERQRELTFRMGINIAMYVLCLDYKDDQVHLPFILHQRQWRVDSPGGPSFP